MCYFVARTNWSNIESNYFMHSIIVRNLPYYTNVTITVTFINQVTLGRHLGRMANLRLVDKRGKELVELKLQVLA